MRFQIPVSALQTKPGSITDPPIPLEGLIAEIFWVTANGQIANDLGRFPVQNGIATGDVDPLPAGLFWAIRLRSGTGGAVFRSGPLQRLPGPPSPIRPNGEISVLLTRGCFTLNQPQSDGMAELVTRHLQNLPSELGFQRVELTGDGQGHYVITVRGRVRVAFFLRRPYAYRRTVRLVGNMAPVRPTPPVIAELVGPPQFQGANVLRHMAVLDRMIKEAVERQLDAALTFVYSIVRHATGSSFREKTMSASELELTLFASPPLLNLCLTFCGGAITGVIVPPTPVLVNEA